MDRASEVAKLKELEALVTGLLWPVDRDLKQIFDNAMASKHWDFAISSLKRYGSLMAHYSTQLKAVPKGKERATLAHQMMDHEIAIFKKTLSLKQTDVCLSCTEGCCYCCHIRVEISGSELDLIKDHIIKKGIVLDWKKIENQAGKEEDAFYNIDLDGACVFLRDDGRCSIYDIRPLSCRHHFSVDDPSKCDMRSPKRRHLGIRMETVKPIFNVMGILEPDTSIDLASALLSIRKELEKG